MTNTKFRKRALLSSVAMLLVALVALGSATFAWFKADPTADATGLSIKATTSAGLEALSDTHNTAKSGDWSHHTVLNAVLDGTTVKTSTDKVTLSPVSQNASAAFFTGAGVDENTWTGTGSFTGTSSGYYHEGISLRVTGVETGGTATVKCTGVSWTEVGGNLKSAVRVALFTGSTYIGTWAPSAGTEDFITGAGTYGAALKDSRAVLASGAESSVTWSVKDDGTLGKVTAYVYLNGENSAVYSSNLTAADAAEMVKDIQINFALA